MSNVLSQDLTLCQDLTLYEVQVFAVKEECKRTTRGVSTEEQCPVQ